MSGLKLLPAPFPVAVTTGDDVTITLDVIDALGAPYAWAGTTVVAPIVGHPTVTGFTIDTSVDGTLVLSLTDAQTTALGSDVGFEWSLSVTVGTATRTWCSGPLSVSRPGKPGVTDTMTGTLIVADSTGAGVVITAVNGAASLVTFTPTGTVAATTVQAAIAEVSGDVTAVTTGLSDHLTDTVDAHDASAISLVDAGSYFDSGNAETALQEVGMYAAAMEMLQPQNQLPVLWLDAAHSVAGEQAAVNRGTGGSALNARYGSTTGADTNDPLLLTHDGENYAYMPGTGGNQLSVPDAANLDITGDLELVARVNVADWSLGTNQTIIGKWDASAGYLLRIADGFLAYYDGGGASTGQFSASTAALDDGEPHWVKLTHNTTTGDVLFFHAVDQPTEPSSWTTLANVSGGGATGARPATTDPVTIGQNGGGFPLGGSIHRAIIRNGIGGTTVLDVNCATDITDSDAATFTATSGQTVTVGRSASGRKTALVTRPIWLFGTDDYMEIADNALLDFGATDSFTVLAVVRNWVTPASLQPYVTKKATVWGVEAGYMITLDVGSMAYLVSDPTTITAATAGGCPVGSLNAAFMIRDRANDILKFEYGALSDSLTDISDSLVNAAAFKIGAGGASYADMELVAVAVFRRALTATEIANICAYYGTV